MQQKIHLFFGGSNHPGMTMTGGTDRYACCKNRGIYCRLHLPAKGLGLFQPQADNSGV